MRPDFDWQYIEGRDHDGDKFAHWVLLHASGRILAKVYCPVNAQGYNFQIAFFATAKGAEKDLRDERNLLFMEEDSAKNYIVSALLTFEEFHGQTVVPEKEPVVVAQESVVHDHLT